MNVNAAAIQLPGNLCIFTRNGSRVRVDTLVCATAKHSVMDAMKVSPTPHMVRGSVLYPPSTHAPARKIVPIPRCEHGTYSPDGDGKPSFYCTGCFSSELGICDGAGLIMSLDDQRDEPFPYGSTLCPECEQPMTIRDEFDFECPGCGFDGA